MNLWKARFTALALAAAVPACYTYPEVEKIAREGVVVADGMAFVADDLQRSQLRTNALVYLDGSSPGPVAADQDVNAAVEAARAMREHFEALAVIANPDTVDFDAEVDTLAREIQKGGLVDAKAANAYANLVSATATALVGFWRQQTIQEVLSASSTDIQKLCETATIISGLAVTQYGLELGAIQSLSQPPAVGGPPRPFELTGMELSSYATEMQDRAAAATALGAAATALATHYSTVAQTPGQLDSKAIEAAVAALVNATSPETNTLRRRMPRRDGAPRNRDPGRSSTREGRDRR